MAKQDVKTNLMDHSAAKIQLLGTYLDAYLNIISRDGYTKRIKVYDLFCGEGMYENGGEGSPLVIIKKIKQLHFQNEAAKVVIPKIDCLFNDIAKDKVEKVKKEITDKKLYYPSYGDLHFKSEDYAELIKGVTAEINSLKDSKAFVFIDPYGYKHIHAMDIKNLLEKKNSEVLLFLPTQFMYRFNEAGTPEALKDFIDEMVPFNEWKKSDSVWKFINQLLDGFRNFLGPDYFVDSFTIQKDANTVFCLFFFSSHIRGFEKMLEAKWKIDQEYGRGWEYSGNEPSLFHEQKTNKLEDLLILYLKESERSNGEVHEYTLRNGFLPTHATQVLTALAETKGFRISRGDGEKPRKKAFYINYKSYKEEYGKIKIKME